MPTLTPRSRIASNCQCFLHPVLCLLSTAVDKKMYNTSTEFGEDMKILCIKDHIYLSVNCFHERASFVLYTKCEFTCLC